MDELLDVLDIVADLGLDGVVVWLFRLVGFVMVLAGIALWLLADIGLVVPALLVVLGLVLLIVPGLFFEVLELA